jgi:hypothetical protein
MRTIPLVLITFVIAPSNIRSSRDCGAKFRFTAKTSRAAFTAAPCSNGPLI